MSRSRKLRLDKLEEQARRAAEAAHAGKFPWFSPRIWEFFARPPKSCHEVALSDRERAELDEWTTAQTDPPGCLRAMAELERVEALAEECQDPHDEG